MALTGAFFSGISGMNAQSQNIAARSDNISNANTVGYKKNAPQFSTLVTENSSARSYAAGGVEFVNRRQVDAQGMIQGSGVVTDLAISGKGMFVVNSENDGSGEYLFTRAGSFREDSLGNFVNSAGFTLMAWPVDNQGRIPGEAGNLNTISNALLDSLEPVNLKAVSSAVAATTQVQFAMNLDSAQLTLEGAGQTISIPTSSAANYGIGLKDLVVPTANINTGSNFIVRTPTQSFTYTYGGVASSNDVSLGILGASSLNGVFSTGVTNGDQFTIGNTSIGTLTFTYTSTSPDPSKGQFNSLATLADAMDRTSGLTARVYGTHLYLSAENANQGLTFTNVGSSTLVTDLGFSNVATSPAAISNDGIASSYDITTTPILAAGTTAALLTAVNGETFTVATPALGTVTFTFSNPIGAATDFNSLNTLATAINTVTGLSANISNNAISIQSDVPSDTMTFGFTGTDFVTAMGLVDTVALPGTVQRFSSLEGLQELINQQTAIEARAITSGTTNAQLKIYNTDPLSTISYEYGYPIPTTSNILAEFGLTRNYHPAIPTNSDSARGVASIPVTGPSYDPLDVSAHNMAGGQLVPHFSRNFEVFDPLGERHDFRISFAKLGINTWGAEVYALNPADIISSTGRTDGLIGYGSIIFNGDGTPRSISPGLTTPIPLRWTNGALDSEVELNLGTAGDPPGTAGASTIAQRDGLTQIRSDYNVRFVDQNGVSAALLSSIEINKEGYVIANYRNGLSQTIYQVPMADFPNFNGLNPLDGNVYGARQQAGAFNLRKPNEGGVGIIKSNALEQSNVDLAEEMTNLIIAQRNYEADTQILKTVNELLERLNRIF
ncbi:flagellar hook-basal body complex protein [Rickettsiales endosymbiont of Stachyamoeba lipophora]|uniref:flagellar hook-basal body complex protein n=1 Tax=Rickettsiales endosymbiont of Stachyamoeba lipophora TaxID=2486578 RepID=UPI000F648C0E|nr:flagellar hook-basal body complex protein [Rickettsiales endosymbiont of Stachyamoeba lipophora]AZL16245.1 flagellar hook-basal body complex protein [Rickettsiales endosymbiont of Stachyamoeba lipophora]